MRWAFTDESLRGKTFVMVAVVVDTHRVNECRATVGQFRRANQVRVHMAKERPARRKQFLDVVGQLAVTTAAVRVSTSGRTAVETRAAAIAATTRLVHAERATKWTIDSVTQADRERDRRTIAAVLRALPNADRRVYDHERSSAEPLLWVADAVAWDCTHDGRLQGVELIDVP